MMRPKVQSFSQSIDGNVATIVGLLAIPLILAATAAIELMDMSNSRMLMQSAVDAGALSGAVQLGVANMQTGNASITDTAISTANNAMAGKTGASSVTFSASVDAQKGAVTVTGDMNRKSLIGFMGFGDAQISVKATAEGLQKVPLCVLQTGDNGGISLENTANIRARGCAIHANQSIFVKNSAMIIADKTQAVGAVTGSISPAGQAGTLPIPDPFASMNLNPPLDCVGKPEKINEKIGVTLVLAPGVHCEHFKIDKDAILILSPGEHYFMDDLDAHTNAIIQGDDVVLIFGSTKKINFADNASVQLGARKSGPFSGFLIITTRDNTEKFTIGSDRVSKLLGTIYIPSAELVIETTGNVAQDSAWSVIVADRLTLRQNPVLVINNRYTGSGVPVPDGVGPSKSAPTLSK